MSKHIDTSCYFICKKYKIGEIDIKYIIIVINNIFFNIFLLIISFNKLVIILSIILSIINEILINLYNEIYITNQKVA